MGWQSKWGKLFGIYVLCPDCAGYEGVDGSNNPNVFICLVIIDYVLGLLVHIWNIPYTFRHSLSLMLPHFLNYFKSLCK